MKKEHTSLFSNLWGAKPVESQKTTPVVITAYSQPHVLQQRMKEEKLTHGETVTANLSPVRLESNFGKMVLYFCPMQSVNILERVEAGDGGALPAEAKLDGITVPGNLKPGLYTLNNVKLFSNGTMQVIATADTEFVPC
jgi:hypothetical protein